MLMDKLHDRLELDSRLTELSRVQPWIEALADLHGLGEDTRFAIQLCMEEALANVVMHGYGNEPGHPLVIQSWVSNGALFFAVEDQAPPFDPSETEPLNNALKPDLESMTPGGNGIRLMRRFAGSLQGHPWCARPRHQPDGRCGRNGGAIAPGRPAGRLASRGRPFHRRAAPVHCRAPCQRMLVGRRRHRTPQPACHARSGRDRDRATGRATWSESPHSGAIPCKLRSQARRTAVIR